MTEKIEVVKVHNVSEYFEQISNFAKKNESHEPKVLWYRGMDYHEHAIVPSMFRDKALMAGTYESRDMYPNIKYAEDIRAQNYIAKNYHSFDKLPSSRLEWLEIMQHQEAKTRVVDWSESAIHSLIFAVEPFLSKRFNTQQRKNQFPCVWVLETTKLNEGVLEFINRKFQDGSAIIDKCLDPLQLSTNQKNFLKSQVNKFVEMVTYGDKDNKYGLNDIEHLKYIYNLSAIMDEINQQSNFFVNALMKNEYPAMFYLFKRLYGDGLIVEDRDLPPLAIVIPYHSERIKLQHGVFTVTPNYQDNKNDRNLRLMGIDPNGMQYNRTVKQCMKRIDIIDPERIAFDLIAAGINTSWLYPELPIMSGEMEYRKVY